MCKVIGIEILAANALIELIESDKDGKVSFDQLDLYGLKVVEYIEKTFKEKAIVVFNKEHLSNLIIDYSDYFIVKENVITKKEGITAEQLRDKFRGPLAFEILKAFMSTEAVAVLND